MKYWEENRFRKKKRRRQLSVGLPLAVAMAAAILMNVYSEWNAAGSILRGGRMIILLSAVLLIVVFIVVFSARHRWEMNDQYYKELLSKKEKNQVP